MQLPVCRIPGLSDRNSAVLSAQIPHEIQTSHRGSMPNDFGKRPRTTICPRNMIGHKATKSAI